MKILQPVPPENAAEIIEWLDEHGDEIPPEGSLAYDKKVDNKQETKTYWKRYTMVLTTNMSAEIDNATKQRLGVYGVPEGENISGDCNDWK